MQCKFIFAHTNSTYGRGYRQVHVQNTQAESQILSFMQTQVSALCALGAGHALSLTACLGLSLDQETRARPGPLMIGHPRLNTPPLVCHFYFLCLWNQNVKLWEKERMIKSCEWMVDAVDGHKWRSGISRQLLELWVEIITTPLHSTALLCMYLSISVRPLTNLKSVRLWDVNSFTVHQFSENWHCYLKFCHWSISLVHHALIN